MLLGRRTHGIPRRLSAVPWSKISSLLCSIPSSVCTYSHCSTSSNFRFPGFPIARPVSVFPGTNICAQGVPAVATLGSRANLPWIPITSMAGQLKTLSGKF